MFHGSLFPVFVVIIFLALPVAAPGKSEPAVSRQGTALPSVGLARYVLQAGPFTIGKAVKNVSGLTYNPLTDTLFLVSNKPTQIVEIDFRGREKQRIRLQGFHDTEGITHIKDNMFAVVEEKRRTVCIIEVAHNSTKIKRADSKAIVVLDPTPAGNKGLEGISYDSERARFYVVKEKNPRRLYQLPWPIIAEKALQVSHPWDIQNNAFSLQDLSGVYSHPDSGNLLLLSDDSASVVETTIEGEELGRLSLQKGGKSGLRKNIPQAEGITMDARGVLFICSEPDLLYVFSVPQPAA